MRVSSFHIDEFGVFSNVGVSGLAPGLSVFYGQNEAGKSTCVEFLRAMLTGWPKRSKKEAWVKAIPLKGGVSGGSVALQEAGGLGEIKIYRNSEGAFNIFDENGASVQEEEFARLFSGVNQDAYRKIFGFGLGELERLENLWADGGKDALFGASFGGSTLAPGQALKSLRERKDKIFKPKSSTLPLNSALLQLEEIRGKISALMENCAAYDALCQELEENSKILEDLRKSKLSLEEKRRKLERRLSVWMQWDKWRSLKAVLEEMGDSGVEFPENGPARLAALEAARRECETRVEIASHKLEALRQKKSEIKPDEALFLELPLLRRLSEHKSGYRQALSQFESFKDSCESIRRNLERNLEQLGSGWTVERVQATDRSIFARRDLERLASEMKASENAWVAARDDLGRANKEVEATSENIHKLMESLQDIPEAEAALNDLERDQLRQNLGRLAECRRSFPARQRALDVAANSFRRAVRSAQIKLGNFEDEESGGGNLEAGLNFSEAKAKLDELLEKRDEALKLAEETQKLKSAHEAAEDDARKAQLEADKFKQKLDKEIDAWRASAGPGREALESRAQNLRSLRSLSATLEREKERLKELDTRLNVEQSVKSGKNSGMLICSLIFFLAGAGILAANLLWNMTELSFGNGMAIPLNLWASYVAILCGVIFLGASLPSNSKDWKRRKAEIVQLQSRRASCALRIGELEASAKKMCEAAGMDELDPYGIDAKEVLLERERDQCANDERALREIDSLKKELAEAQGAASALVEAARLKENDVQKSRRRWHGLMQGVDAGIVPLPENAAAFFARVEAARLAYDNIENAQAEIDDLNNEMTSLEKSVSSVPAIVHSLETSGGALNLDEAANLILDSCRGADAVQAQRTRVEENIHDAEDRLAEAQKWQKEASGQFDICASHLESRKTEWNEAIEKLGLGQALSPDAVSEAYKLMESCLLDTDRLASEEKALEKAQNEITALQEPLAALATRLNRPVIKDVFGADDWLAALDSLIADAETAEKQRLACDNLLESLENETAELGMAEIALASAKARENDLLAQAGVSGADEFLRLAKAREERKNLIEDINRVEKDLTVAADGAPLDEFVEEFKAESREDQEKALADISAQLDEISDQNLEKAKYVGELRAKTQSMACDGELAGLRQEESMLMESVERMALAWSGAALAESLLVKAKNIYEKEKQPELIKEASRIFAKITGGRWQGIAVSLDDSSLMMLPARGLPVGPERLSRGAREQAYLAMRLAHIVKRARGAVSLPVMIDEAFVNFDPERAERAVRALAELAEDRENPIQILYFTCHPHIKDILRQAAPDAPVFNIENQTILAA